MKPVIGIKGHIWRRKKVKNGSIWLCEKCGLAAEYGSREKLIAGYLSSSLYDLPFPPRSNNFYNYGKLIIYWGHCNDIIINSVMDS
jgi:hypothetical protein